MEIAVNASLYALLPALGGAVGWFFNTIFGRRDRRETELLRREREYQDKIDAQLAELNSRFTRLEKANTLLIGVVHVIIDDLEPEHTTLEAISNLLKDAYPVSADTPADLLNLTARLDAKTKRRRRA